MSALVLLVDDDISLRSVMAGTLRDAGYEVKEADNGIDALEIYKASKPAVIIADLKMPQMGGMELITKLRDGGDTTPVIILTSDKKIDDINYAIELRVTDYFNKSDTNLGLIVESVQRCIGSNQTEQP